MKYLCYCLIISFLFLAGRLSAQQYRLRADVGMSGVFKNDQLTAPVVALGLEALISLSPRTFLVPEMGLQQTHIFDKGLERIPAVIPGQAPINFVDLESYKMKRTSAFVGIGLERHLRRVRLQFFGRVVKGIADRITFKERTNFPGPDRPDNVFSITVKPGEVFAQGMQSGTLRYNQEFTFSTGLSVRFDLSEGVELGMSYLHAIGNSQLERRVISFCENCEVTPDAAPVRMVSALTNTASISGRWTF